MMQFMNIFQTSQYTLAYINILLIYVYILSSPILVTVYSPFVFVFGLALKSEEQKLVIFCVFVFYFLICHL